MFTVPFCQKNCHEHDSNVSKNLHIYPVNMSTIKLHKVQFRVFKVGHQWVLMGMHTYYTNLFIYIYLCTIHQVLQIPNLPKKLQ